ncbi:hypothetical protein BJV82DRAFT_102605 [Fennellomyces sp. T-0311]|nr:hypothetical protein BJV82DRAFT_102605 [Fennellomyces sp. T-0311]
MGAIRKLINMPDDKKPAQTKVLLGLSNLVQKLPKKTLLEDEPQGETELWSSTFDPVLTPIFSCPERDVLLRWSNVIPAEGSLSSVLNMRPDAIICQIDQLRWSLSLGHGEAKLSEPNPNIDALAQDLLRLAVLNKKPLMNSSLKAAIAFQIHGYRTKVYMTKPIAGSTILTMTEVLSMKFPRSVEELDMFVTRHNLERLVHLHDVFWGNCFVGNDNQHTETPEKKGDECSTFDFYTTDSIRQSSPDRRRRCSLRYYVVLLNEKRFSNNETKIR